MTKIGIMAPMQPYPVPPMRPYDKKNSSDSVADLSFSAAAGAAATVLLGPIHTISGLVSTRAAHLLNEKVPNTLSMYIATAAALKASPYLYGASAIAAKAVSAAAAGAYENVAQLVQYVVNDPLATAKIVLDGMGSVVPQIAAPVVLLTAVALSRPKSTY